MSDPRADVAAALRRLGVLAVAGVLDDADLGAAAGELAGLASRLEERAGPGRPPRERPDVEGSPADFFPASPVMGSHNPIAPPVHLWAVTGEGGGREIAGTANFDYRYEGPPTCVHGGVIAEGFDEMLGSANLVAGAPGMTGTLKVRYRRPTPLRTDIRLEARFVERSGRKISTWAGMYAGDELTAEAEGIFIEVAPEQMLAIAEANVDSADPTIVEAIRAEARRVDREGFTD